jgi:hypothetical protein
MKVSDLTSQLKKKFEIDGEIALIVKEVDRITDPELTLKQSGISEGVTIVIVEKLIAQSVLPVPI